MNDLVLLDRVDAVATVTLNNPARRNALSLAMIRRLTAVLREVADTDAAGVLLAAEGPAFSSGHDFADMAGRPYPEMRGLLRECSEMMLLIQQMPQVVLAKVQGPAFAAGCQLVASCDLAVASDEATFSIPGGQAGWFCHTPSVAVARAVPRKRALEMALTGDAFPAAQVAEWGLINYAVPAAEVDERAAELLSRATRGSALSKALGKQTFHRQIDLEIRQAYDLATEAMAASSTTEDGQESMNRFIEKRSAKYVNR